MKERANQADLLAPFMEKGRIEVGCDEAGRGCLAGPVVAGAVILDLNKEWDFLNDSKKLSQLSREKSEQLIKQNAIAWAVAEVDHKRIDEINILNASIEAMHLALGNIRESFDCILVDGNRFKPYGEHTHECVVKGDGKYMSIAAASILAKTHRDQMMREYDLHYPGYDWSGNKGYPTKKHRKAIAAIGASPIHRKSFRLLAEEQLNLNFP